MREGKQQAHKLESWQRWEAEMERKNKFVTALLLNNVNDLKAIWQGHLDNSDNGPRNKWNAQGMPPQRKEERKLIRRAATFIVAASKKNKSELKGI